MKMKKYYRYSDSRGRSILTTSHETGQRWMRKNLTTHENAVFSGEFFAKEDHLERLERGVYRLNPDWNEMY